MTAPALPRIGDVVWWGEYSTRRGPLPATVYGFDAGRVRLSVHGDGPGNVTVGWWLDEDGTDTGWFIPPADGELPGDFFD